jgi:DNA-binding CsgD family transcriptional regulator
MARRLTELSIVPHLRPEVVEAIVPDSADVLDEAVRSGFVTRDPAAGYAFHPLLRSFFHSKVVSERDHNARAVTAARVLLEQHLWEDAFDVIRSFQLDDLLPDLFEGLNELLSQGRLATVERWITYSSEAGRHFPLVDLAEAEVARRQGRFDIGETLALQAAQRLEGAPALSRAYAVAGECRYYDGHSFATSLDFLRKAEALAKKPEDEQRALWGQVLCATELEEANMEDLIERLASKRSGDPNLEMRIASARTLAASFSSHVGDAAVEAERMMSVASRATDPWAKTFYLYEVAYLCVLSSRYDRAADVARIGLEEAERLRLGFARTHLLTVSAFAQIGLRLLKRAELSIKVAADAAREGQDQFGKVNITGLSARLELSRRRPEAALTILDGLELSHVHPALRGECRALHAVAAVIAGDKRSAIRLASTAEGETSEVQTQCYAALARAIARPTKTTLASAVRVLEMTQAYDCLVCASRSHPKLLRDVAAVPNVIDLPAILRQARDFKLAATAGIELDAATAAGSRFDLLTKRERQVLALICEGLTNAEIASRLFLSPATVKLHLRHIYAKLRVRSRTEAVLFADRESDQF